VRQHFQGFTFSVVAKVFHDSMSVALKAGLRLSFWSRFASHDHRVMNGPCMTLQGQAPRQKAVSGEGKILGNFNFKW
jgi:hypothetical protein